MDSLVEGCLIEHSEHEGWTVLGRRALEAGLQPEGLGLGVSSPITHSAGWSSFLFVKWGW